MKTCKRCGRDYPDEVDFVFNDGVEICPSCDRMPYPWDFIDPDPDNPPEEDEWICCGYRTSGGYCNICGSQYG